MLLQSFPGNHSAHITFQHHQLHTHHSTVLTYNPQKKCAGTHHYIMVHNSPSAIQSHGRQGQPGTQSHPSPALIITLGPLQEESGSPVPEIVARKRLYRTKSLCNPILIQACILLSGWEKYSSGLSRKVCVSVNACQRAYSIRTHTNTGIVRAKSVCGKRGACDSWVSRKLWQK